MKGVAWIGGLWIVILIGEISFGETAGQPPPASTEVAPTSSRLKINSSNSVPPAEAPPFIVPLPAHALPQDSSASSQGFRINPGRNPSPSRPEKFQPSANYLLSDRDEKPPITPENSNLNLPTELEITATETGEKILLPAGTYRQILQLPIDSPLWQTADKNRKGPTPLAQEKKELSKFAEPEKKPVWVRYESLEKIKIGDAERRGGIDLPAHAPKSLGPRVWYAKSETADWASSVFYFAFGGLGYSTANLLGWSAGNTREIPGDFEYRLIRK